MTDAQTPFMEKISTYFTRNDLLIIIGLAIIAFLTASYGLVHVLPGGSAPGLVHGFLKLPGPGAGIFISSAFTCLWLVLGILLTRKPGTVIAIAVLIFVFSLVVSLALPASPAGAPSAAVTAAGEKTVGSTSGTGAPAGGAPAGVPAGNVRIRLDYLAVVVAIIIECAGLLPLGEKPWRFVFPALLSLMGLVTLALWLTGNAKMGENGAAATVFPLGYVVAGLLAIALAILLYSYPSAKFIIGAGCAEVFYIVFCWLFNGKTGFATWVPVGPAIPALLTFAFVCGAVMAAIAYGFFLLWEAYGSHGSKTVS